jgi:hypothetical protein
VFADARRADMVKVNRMPILKKPPLHEEVALALGGLLNAAGIAGAAQQMKVAAVAGTRHPAYHVLAAELATKATSEMLAEVLARSFSSDYSGWLIDLREARSIIEAAHRLAKARDGKPRGD